MKYYDIVDWQKTRLKHEEHEEYHCLAVSPRRCREHYVTTVRQAGRACMGGTSREHPGMYVQRLINQLASL